MIEPPPPRPGEPLRASWAQRLVTYVRSLRVIAGPGLVGRRTSAGTVLSLAAGAGRAKPAAVDEAVLGVVGVPVSNDQMVVALYPHGLSGPEGRTVCLHSPCVFRRAPLVAGDIVLCHPCAVAVTGEGEES